MARVLFMIMNYLTAGRGTLDFKNAQLDLTSHSVIRFIIDNFGFSCIAFLHSSLTFLQATLSIIPFTSASDNSLITPPLTSCHPNLPTHLPMFLIQLPFSHSIAWDATFLSSLPSYTLLVNTLILTASHPNTSISLPQWCVVNQVEWLPLGYPALF